MIVVVAILVVIIGLVAYFNLKKSGKTQEAFIAIVA